jgi:hypothetical protein
MGSDAVRNASATVLTTDTEISPSYEGGASQRIELCVVNTSTGGEIIYLSFGQEAAAGVGITLYPTGSYNSPANMLPSQLRVSGAASAATATCSIFERIYTR